MNVDNVTSQSPNWPLEIQAEIKGPCDCGKSNMQTNSSETTLTHCLRWLLQLDQLDIRNGWIHGTIKGSFDPSRLKLLENDRIVVGKRSGWNLERKSELASGPIWVANCPQNSARHRLSASSNQACATISIKTQTAQRGDLFKMGSAPWFSCTTNCHPAIRWRGSLCRRILDPPQPPPFSPKLWRSRDHPFVSFERCKKGFLQISQEGLVWVFETRLVV